MLKLKDQSQNMFGVKSADSGEILNIEKTPPTSLSSKTYSRNVWLAQSKCAHYEMIRTKLKLIQAAVSDGNVVESGFEDVISSADSITEDKAQLKSEIKRLNGRLNFAREKIGELHAYLTAQNISSSTTARCLCGCIGNMRSSWTAGQTTTANAADTHALTLVRDQSRNGSDGSSSKMEHLRAENVLLNARLVESSKLVRMLVREYNNQLDKTSRLGKLIRSIYSIDEE
ncbi:unnamed protein product [Gongylonema pulchrum]|uniref:CENP-H domain-containing protein n=1 Tax=Gongylonema pulchrum TaxID=637853 RepID=A0A183CVC7_9BILA|nr:unnamed protein product [Gongylonema pulchrum]